MSDEIEEWRVSRLYPKYEVSNLGRVRGIRRKHIMKQTLQYPDKPDGYLQVARHDDVKEEIKNI